MAPRLVFFVAGILAFASNQVAGESEPSTGKCFTNDKTNVQVCCDREVPILLHSTILWNMLPEMCNDTSCSKEESHQLYIGGRSHVADIVNTKSKLSSKRERDDLVNTFLQANTSGLVMAWNEPKHAGSGNANDFYTFAECRTQSMKADTFIELSRSLLQSI